jgi:hypothetical protein
MLIIRFIYLISRGFLKKFAERRNRVACANTRPQAIEGYRKTGSSSVVVVPRKIRFEMRVIGSLGG